MTPPLVLAALGLIGAVLIPGYLATSSAGGIPRWIPLGAALILWFVALRSCVPVWPFPALAAFWALGSASYARPALRDAYGIDLEAWPFLVAAALSLVVAVAALLTRAGRRARIAAFAAVGMSAFVAVDLAFPVVPLVDGISYALAVAAASLTWRAAGDQRAFER